MSDGDPEPNPHDRLDPRPNRITSPTTTLRAASSAEPAFVCERCGVAMYRMHAVWRCPNCGFKTDCCAW
jgi:rubrerythrin